PIRQTSAYESCTILNWLHQTISVQFGSLSLLETSEKQVEMVKNDLSSLAHQDELSNSSTNNKNNSAATAYLNQHHLGGIEPIISPYTSYINQPPNQLSQFGIGPIQPNYATLYPAEAQRGVMGYYADPSYPQALLVTSSVGGFQGRDKYSQETPSNSSSTQSVSASPYGYPTTPTTPSTPHYSNTRYDEMSPLIHHLPGAVPNVHNYQKTYGGGSGMPPINFLGNAGGVSKKNKKTVSVADIADTEEVKKLRSLYKDKLATLQEMFEDWTEADLLFTLNEAEGDIELTVSRISDGHTSQWGEVKSRKSKKDHSNKTKSTGQPGVSQRGSAGSGVVTNVTGNSGNGRSRGRGGRRDDRTNSSSRAIKKENGSGHGRTSRQHPNGPSSSFHHNETSNGNQFKSSTTNDSNSWGNNDSSGGGNNWSSDANNDEFLTNNDWNSNETKSWGDTEPTFITKSTKNEVVPSSSQNTATNWSSTIESKTEGSWGDEDINISTTTTATSSNDFSKDDSNLNKDGWASSSSDTHHNSNELRVSDNCNNNKNSRDFSKSYKNSTTSKPYSYSSSTPTPSSSNKSPVPPKSRTIPPQSKTSWAQIVKPDQKPEHKPETTSTTPIQQHHNNTNTKGSLEATKPSSPNISKTTPPIPTQSPSKVVEQVIINDNNNISINNDFQQETISTTSTPEIAISEIEETKKKSPPASSPLLNKEVLTPPSNATGISNILSTSATNTPSSQPSSPTPTSNSLQQQTTPSPSLSAANATTINNNI
ncbi:2360_t:CDS:10, partial [Entrophospora sp. SA101]